MARALARRHRTWREADDRYGPARLVKALVGPWDAFPGWIPQIASWFLPLISDASGRFSRSQNSSFAPSCHDSDSQRVYKHMKKQKVPGMGTKPPRGRYSRAVCVVFSSDFREIT